MSNLAMGEQLETYEVEAYNFAEDSDNKIHSNEMAKAYGFRGGLVPGVGDHAYMTAPAARDLGRDWLERGTMESKYLQPIYHGEIARVQAKVVGEEPLKIEIELLNSKGELCGVGAAGMGEAHPEIDPADFPAKSLPAREDRIEANVESLPAGLALGSIDFELKMDEAAAKARDAYHDPLEMYQGAGATCHPAFLLELANDILVENIALGPWIHTASRTRHHSLARAGEKLSLRGSVEKSYIKRGHHIAELNLGLFGEGDRVIQQINHSAIVRLRDPELS